MNGRELFYLCTNGRVAVVVAMSIGAVSCSSNSSGSGPQTGAMGGSVTTDPGQKIECANDSRAESPDWPLMKPGASQIFTFGIIGAVPTKPAMNTNKWTLKVTDSAGHPVTDATVTLPVSSHPNPYMPDHNHGSSNVPSVSSHGDGTYDVDDLFFTMGGIWQVTFAAKNATASDTGTFTFCIGD